MVAKTRIVLADDHPQMRARVREALEAGEFGVGGGAATAGQGAGGGARRALAAGAFEVCGGAANAAQAVEMALQFKPEVVLLDIHMPGNGIRAAREVSTVLPQSLVVMLTQSRDE